MASGSQTIVIVDDEHRSPIMAAVSARLVAEGWSPVPVVPSPDRPVTGDDFEDAALHAISELSPGAVLLDVRFGEHKDDQFKGLSILQRITEQHPDLPVLMFTQYARGPERETAVRSTLGRATKVDFVDKLASPEEVLLRLRRLVGTTPASIRVGDLLIVDTTARCVFAVVSGEPEIVAGITGMQFEVLRELAATWYTSPGEVVPFSKLERYSEGDDPRASLRVRVREIKDAVGQALGIRFGASELIANVRDQGYRLVPPR